MRRDEFVDFLSSNGVTEDSIEQSLKAIGEFEKYLKENTDADDIDFVSERDTQKYLRELYKTGMDEWQNLVPIYRYGLFTGNIALKESVFRLMDGCDVMNVLHAEVADVLGEEERDRVFEGVSLPTPGMPAEEKPRFTREILSRLDSVTDSGVCRQIITEVAHGLPDDFWKQEHENFLKAGNIDAYLVQKRERAMANLEEHHRDGMHFFGQEITKEVLDFVRSRPDMLTGERQGNRIYHTKIPYNTRDYLKADDDKTRRYHVCHCAWARESILSDEDDVPYQFCYCSAGFTKKPWEQALGTKLEVELVKSALKGDMECSFTITIPEEFLSDTE